MCVPRYKIPRTKAGVRFVHGDAREVDMTGADVIWLNDAVRSRDQVFDLRHIDLAAAAHVNESLRGS